MRTPIPTVGGAYTHDTLSFDTQTCVNLYPERGGPQSSSESLLRRCPGTTLYLSANGSGAIRGMYVTSTGRFFVVRGSTLVEIFSGAAQTTRGTIGSGTNAISMTDNGLQLAIADGTNIWSFVLSTNTLATITDPNAVAPDNTPKLAFIDQYIFGFDPTAANLGQFRHSNLRDVDTWDAIDVYTAESSPDRLVSMIANRGELWLFGSKSYDVYYNAGGDNSAPTNPTWARVPGAFNHIGCMAPDSVVSMLNSVFWLGTSAEGPSVVYMSNGYTATPISTKAITSQINDLSNISDARGYATQLGGHYFYHITFAIGDKTFVYDMTENEWHERPYRDPTTGAQGRNRALDSVTFNNKVFVSDYENGNIYELTKNTYDDNGDPQLCERKLPYIGGLKQRINCPWIQFDVLTGEGLLSGQGIDPKVKLRWSDDGGRTWSNWREKGIGARGEYGTRVIFRLLGQFRDRVFHITYSDPTPFSIQNSTVAELISGTS